MDWEIEITIIAAMPAMADVISGTTPEPRPPRPDEHWWHWAVQTHAGRRALQAIECTIDPEAPWLNSAEGWRCQPWRDPGETEPSPQYDDAVGRLREAFGEGLAGVFYCEREVAGPWPRQHTDQAFVVVNEDGTRAAVGILSESEEDIAPLPTSVRLSGPTRRRLRWLAQRYRNQTTVLQMAIDRMYREEGGR